MTAYKQGASNYLDVITAQTAALDAQRTALIVATRRYEASVGLILALGGDWSVDELAPVNVVNSTNSAASAPIGASRYRT